MASSKPELKVINIIFYALLAGQFLFALATVLWAGATTRETVYIFGPRQDLYALIGYAIIMIGMARFMDKTRARSAANLRRLGGDGANGHYRTTVIVRLALLEGAAFMVLTLILLARNQYLYLVLLPLLGAFWLARPLDAEFVGRYGISLEDQ